MINSIDKAQFVYDIIIYFMKYDTSEIKAVLIASSRISCSYKACDCLGSIILTVFLVWKGFYPRLLIKLHILILSKIDISTIIL